MTNITIFKIVSVFVVTVLVQLAILSSSEKEDNHQSETAKMTTPLQKDVVKQDDLF